jgi:hypothetical protein
MAYDVPGIEFQNSSRRNHRLVAAIAASIIAFSGRQTAPPRRL